MAAVIIKPYIDKDDGIGLGTMGLNSFPGTKKIIQVPVKHGKYLTGFDVEAFYLSQMEEKERKKEVDRIKKLCEMYEKRYPQYTVADPSLANEFFRNLLIELGAENTILDTNNPLDAIKLEIIKTNAKYNRDFIVAPSFIEAETSNRDYKFFISDADLDVVDEVSHKRAVNAAISKLDDISENDKTKYLMVIKYLLSPDKSYNHESPDRLYKRGDDYIRGIVNGEKVAGDIKDFYKNFVRACEMSREELIKRVVVKYAIFQNVIKVNKDKEFFYAKTGQALGRTPEEVYQLLSAAKNTDIYKEIYEEVDREIKVY